jgi:hypothetical protein
MNKLLLIAAFVTSFISVKAQAYDSISVSLTEVIFHEPQSMSTPYALHQVKFICFGSQYVDIYEYVTGKKCLLPRTRK